MSQALVLSGADPTVRTAVSFIQRLFPAPRPYSIVLWDGTELPAEGPPRFSLVLKHPGALRRMFTPPIDLALAGPTSTATSISKATSSRSTGSRSTLPPETYRRERRPASPASSWRCQEPGLRNPRRAAPPTCAAACTPAKATWPRFSITMTWATSPTPCGSTATCSTPALTFPPERRTSTLRRSTRWGTSAASCA